ncbi:MAG: hypothetical protein GDA51_06305 [Ekhidna sp.]|nr:hypothetical protein [Ekhidna sp.]MBC6426069.1 hypothetical protein [Ekhidna sp.]
MKTIEIHSRTDQKGYLKIKQKLGVSEKNVRVCIFFDEEETDNEDSLYLKSISNNPAFDFLNDPAEDIYSLTDGTPIND